MKKNFDYSTMEDDLFACLEPETVPEVREKAPSLQDMRRMALGFLASLKPSALADSVPVRFRKYKTAAAFWAADTGKVRQVSRTAVVEVYRRRDICFPDCAGIDTLLERMRTLREEKTRIEAQIRLEEPELADPGDLFSDMRTWHYERSANPDYRRVTRELARIQNAVYHGSRTERIRNAKAADLLYLAVPAGVLSPDECPAGWGLLIMKHDGTIECAVQPELQECKPECRNHLALNIAQAAAENVLFANGISASGGKVRLTRLPKRRRKVTHTLNQV